MWRTGGRHRRAPCRLTGQPSGLNWAGGLTRSPYVTAHHTWTADMERRLSRRRARPPLLKVGDAADAAVSAPGFTAKQMVGVARFELASTASACRHPSRRRKRAVGCLCGPSRPLRGLQHGACARPPADLDMQARGVRSSGPRASGRLPAGCRRLPQMPALTDAEWGQIVTMAVVVEQAAGARGDGDEVGAWPSSRAVQAPGGGAVRDRLARGSSGPAVPFRQAAEWQPHCVVVLGPTKRPGRSKGVPVDLPADRAQALR